MRGVDEKFQVSEALIADEGLSPGDRTEGAMLLLVDGGSFVNLRSFLSGTGTAEQQRLAVLELSQASFGEAVLHLERLQALPKETPGREQLIRAALSKIAEVDPLFAMAETSSITSMAGSERARIDVLKTWGRMAPEQALSYLKQSSDGVTQRVFSNRMEALVETYATVDRFGALNLVASMPSDTWADRRLRDSMAESLMLGVLETGGVLAAKEILLGLPEARLQERAVRQLVGKLAETDPLGAVSLLNELPEDLRENGRAVISLMRSWAGNDPVEAAAYVSSMDFESRNAGEAVTVVVEQWSRYDLEGPGVWLNQLPSGPLVDRALSIYATRAAQEDPMAAASWAETISSEQRRDRSLARIARIWKETDAEGFENWIEKVELPEESRERIRNMADRGGSEGGFRRWGQ